MNAHAAQQLQEQYADLMDRAKTMHACGYYASADALRLRAWSCAARRVAVEERLVVANSEARSSVTKHA
jgi:hypothetical protein